MKKAKKILWVLPIILVICLIYVKVTEVKTPKHIEILNNDAFQVIETDRGILSITYKLENNGVVLINNTSKEEAKDYKYILKPGDTHVIALTDGVGAYKVTLHDVENTGGNVGSILKTYECNEINLAEEDELQVFTKNTTLIDFESNSDIIDEVFKDTNDVDEIYIYFKNMGYDYRLADKISKGVITDYSVDIKSTIENKKGICYDLATSMTAVLRHKGYTAQMVYGYVNNTYHSWVRVLIDNEWFAYDPTLDKTSYDTHMDLYVIDEYH